MGRKVKVKEEKLAIEHIVSKINIQKAKCCQYCPLRLYTGKEDKIIFGVGNIITDIIMVLPSYDTKAKIEYNTILRIVENAYKNIIGKELLEEVYVTRTVKCFKRTDFNLEKEAIKFCFSNLFYEINRITPKKIIIFDKELYNFGLYNCIKGKYDIKTVVSPGVMYYDNQNLKDIFIKQFKEAII